MGFSQKVDTLPTLAVKLTTQAPLIYKDNDGTTVIIGEVENTRNFPVRDVKILVDFYDQFSSQPIESTLGTTILDVIPPFGKSPYVIKSKSQNSAIIDASPRIVGFLSSAPKQQLLTIGEGTLDVSNQLSYKALISNNGQVAAKNIKVHLGIFDPFIPPRILKVVTLTVPIIEGGSSAPIEFNEPLDYRAVSFKIIAESEQYYSNIVTVPLPKQEPLTKLVTINDITLTDDEGNRLSNIPFGSTAKLQSNIWIQYAEDQKQTAQPYVYWIQIKQSGEKAFVEFIGKAEGIFDTASTQNPFVEWTPDNPGLYFVETFVWEPNGIALASQGPISLILVK
jgi:hypothetical protein